MSASEKYRATYVRRLDWVFDRIQAGDVLRCDDFEYRVLDFRPRNVRKADVDARCSDAVYHLERHGHVDLHPDGTVTITDAGIRWRATVKPGSKPAVPEPALAGAA